MEAYVESENSTEGEESDVACSIGLFPTKVQLRKKQVNIDDLCPMCNAESESICHALLDCSFSKECWNCIGIDISRETQSSFLQWFSKYFDIWSAEQRQLGSMLCWTLWKCRNDLVWNQRGMEVIEVIESAKTVLNQWQIAQDKSFDNFMGLMTHADGDDHWKLPTENKIKVNTDVAIFESRSSCLPGRITPDCAEAIGIREALSWIKNGNHMQVRVETDSLVTVQAIRSNGILLSYFGRIIKECKELLSSLNNREMSVNFVKRSANNVAHCIARYKCSVADRVWRLSDTPPEFINVLMNDLKS